MKSRLFIATLLIIVTLIASGGITVSWAHFTHEIAYHNIVVDILEYERIEYNNYDLVRMNLSIENLADYTIINPVFLLGGAVQYVDDPLINPDTDTKSWYEDSTYADVRGRGGDVAVEECTSVDRFTFIEPAKTGETSLCFMIGKSFEPDGLMIQEILKTPNHSQFNYFASEHYGKSGYDRAAEHHHDECWSNDDAHGKHVHKTGWNTWTMPDYHICADSAYTQVVPFHDESTFCFDLQFEWCNGDNIQSIDGVATHATEPPAHATLLHTLYHNHTGTLVLMFDRPVIANNPDRLYLIHNIDLFLENGTAPDLGDSEMYTVDGKRQSTILAFALDNMLRLVVTDSLREYGNLALLIDMRAVYVAEDFTDITKKNDSQILIPDVLVVR